MIKTFEIYWNDLTEAAQKRFYDFLGGDIGNYDVFPIDVFEVEVDDDEKRE